jgi:selenocysteine lyase/cysteine desulfurase
VVSTQLEHNSVLRPLHHLRSQGVLTFDLAPVDGNGFVDPGDIAKRIQTDTELVIVSHASNVLGTVQPIAEIGRFCADRHVPLLVDTAQSAGRIPIDMEAMGVAAAAFTGHKSLHGPTGIGGLVLHPDIDIRSTRFGGTGIDSGKLLHTQRFPHRLEAGTVNVMGIMGLSAGLDFLNEQGIDTLHNREMKLLGQLRDGLARFERVQSYCVQDLNRHVGLMTIAVRGTDAEDVGAILDADFDIQVRVGLHCAPLVHKAIGTYPRGAVRFSPGLFNTRQDIDRAVEAIGRIASA